MIAVENNPTIPMMANMMLDSDQVIAASLRECVMNVDQKKYRRNVLLIATDCNFD
jgi:hypothetical protein